MRVMTLALIGSLLVSIPGPAGSVWAQEQGSTLVLPLLLEEVRRVNPDLAAARKRVEAAQARIPQTAGLPPPRIGVEFEEIPSGTVKLNRATTMYQLIQSLPFLGKLSAKKRVAVAEAQMIAADYKRMEWDILTRLKTVYYDLYLLDREMEIQQEQLVWLRRSEATAEAGYAAGTSSHMDLLQAQSDLLEAATQVEVLRQRRLAMAAHLNHLMNRPIHDPVGPVSEPEFIPVPSDPEALFLQAVENQPDLQVFKYSAERSEAEWKLAKRELLPDLESMLELRNPAMGPIGPWDLTLALTLPFWFWTKERYGVRVALKDKESAQEAYTAVRNAVARRIHEHWHEARAEYETALLFRDGLIPKARQAVESALSGYQGGQVSYGDLLGSIRMLNERRRSYYQSLVHLEQRISMLEEAVGVPLRPQHRQTAEEGESP
ncbi:MAG: TolC family protein [Candidatus Omnitrophica bacterium]|nr:TolC family protein [Candidatus Omnitrophota bacterium]